LHTTIQEVLLVFVLLLDISIHVYLLNILLLDVLVQTVVNCKLELAEVINILDHPENSRLEALNVVLVVPDLLSALTVKLGEIQLFISEFVNDKA
jgi:hypothetical protein